MIISYSLLRSDVLFCLRSSAIIVTIVLQFSQDRLTWEPDLSDRTIGLSDQQRSEVRSVKKLMEKSVILLRSCNCDRKSTIGDRDRAGDRVQDRAATKDFGICGKLFLGHFKNLIFSTKFWIFEISINFSYVGLYLDRTIHIFSYVELYIYTYGSYDPYLLLC